MRVFFVFCILIMSWFRVTAQEKLMNIEINGKSVPVVIIDGDTMMIMNLQQIDIKAPHKFASFTEETTYRKYKRYAITVFPYAVKAIKVFREMESATQGMKERQKKKYIKKLAKELEEEFEKPLKNLSKTQGRILVKMIEKELDTPMYGLVRDLKGGWSAFYWNTFSSFYGYDLKEGYIKETDPILDMVLDDFDIDYTIRNEKNFGIPVEQKK